MAALLLGARSLLAQVYFDPMMSQARLSPPPSNSKPEDRCVLQGHVTNALTGESKKKVHVRLRRQMPAISSEKAQQNAQGYVTISDAEGNFKFENIEPGDYRLSGDRSGYRNTEYGAKDHRRGSTITLGPAQQVTNLSLALMPQAVVSGKVIDQDGDPVEGAMVQLVGEMWERGKLRHAMQNGSNTNDLGQYRIPNVTPGKYYLLVDRVSGMADNDIPVDPGKPDIRPVKTFYPEAPTIESATQLDVKAGQDLSGMDIRVLSAPTYHVRGKIVGSVPEGVTGRLGVSASMRGAEDMSSFAVGSNVAKDRSFDIPGLSPGSYTLNLMTRGRGFHVLGHVDIAVGQSDVNDVQLAIVPPGVVHGHVTFEGNPQAGSSVANVKNMQIYLQGTDNTMMYGNNNATPNDDGSFTIDNVAPGKYQLNAPAPSGTYLKSVRLGNQEMLGKDLDLGQGSGQLNLIFSYGIGEVQGTVQLPQTASEDPSTSAQPATTADTSIVLIPDTLNEDGSGMYFGQSGAGGAFTIRQVAPGHYRAYAFEQIDYEQLQNPDLLKQLESKGTDVEVKEHDNKQIQVPLIAQDDLQRIYSQLGIQAPQL
jgi:protocatechuate 3,4-dioxygenase beta subunit